MAKQPDEIVELKRRCSALIDQHSKQLEDLDVARSAFLSRKSEADRTFDELARITNELAAVSPDLKRQIAAAVA